MGYSMGAFESLFIAATESTNESPLIKFDRYVAINTPVRLLMGFPSWTNITGRLWTGRPRNEPTTSKTPF